MKIGDLNHSKLCRKVFIDYLLKQLEINSDSEHPIQFNDFYRFVKLIFNNVEINKDVVYKMFLY